MSDVLSPDLILENKTILVTKPCSISHKIVVLVGSVAQVRSDTRNKRPSVKMLPFI